MPQKFNILLRSRELKQTAILNPLSSPKLVLSEEALELMEIWSVKNTSSIVKYNVALKISFKSFH